MEPSTRGRYSIWKRSITASVFLCLVSISHAHAQEQTISQMAHTVWTARDGAPPGIRALAQTPDGILWIASLKGLYTFDGLTFASFHPSPGSPDIPPMTLRDLFVAKSGDLWVAGYHGPAVRVRQGQVTVCNVPGATPNDALNYLQQDAAGAMWAVAQDRELVRLGTDDVWHPMPSPIPEPGHIELLFIDSIGTQWVIENDRLYRRPQGLKQFLPTEVSAHFQPIIKEGADRTIWILAPVSETKPGQTRVSQIQRVDQSGRRLVGPMDVGDPSDILPDTEGSLWITKVGDELQRLRSGDIPGWHPGHKTEAADLVKLGGGFGSWDSHALMLDTNGAIWAGGLERLERFAPATLVPAIPGANAGYWYSCVDPSGDVFISHPPTELYRIHEGRLARVKTVKKSWNIFCARDGTLYMDADGIATLRDGKEDHLPLLPGFTGYGDDYAFTGFLPVPDRGVVGVAAGTNGATGLWLYNNSQWSRFFPNKHFAEVTTMFVDSRRTIYLGHADGAISLIRGNVFTRLRVDPPPISAVNGFAETSFGVFAHAARGIGIVQPDHFQVLHLEESDYAKGVTGLAQAQNGDIWINGFDGIVRIPSTEISAALADPTHKISATNFQEQNFKGPSMLLLFSDTVHLDPHGKLWFSMLNGVVSVDPQHLGSPHAPQLAIRAITADGSPPNARHEFPPNIATLDVQYFGVNLTDPRSVVYRYQLEGLDSGWQDVGHRTEAIYTHPRPGQYRFRLMASNGDGVWTAPVASAPFTVLPSFYQTWWFAALGMVTGVLLVWVGLRARVRYVSHAIRIRAEERADERIRIARELHDTLLQGIQGLLLSFHVAAEKVPLGHESRKALEKALSTADRIILDGRNRVNRLRSDHLIATELEPSIEAVADDLSGLSKVHFTLERSGSRKALNLDVVEEIFYITREALTNSFRHSGASRIVVGLDYQTREFKMTCRDNGLGFDTEALSSSESNGHWGLRGMAERAERIGANFSCRSSAGEGTVVQIRIPARRAYARTPALQKNT